MPLSGLALTLLVLLLYLVPPPLLPLSLPLLLSSKSMHWHGLETSVPACGLRSASWPTWPISWGWAGVVCLAVGPDKAGLEGEAFWFFFRRILGQGPGCGCGCGCGCGLLILCVFTYACGGWSISPGRQTRSARFDLTSSGSRQYYALLLAVDDLRDKKEKCV